MHTKFTDKYLTLGLSITVYENKINDFHGIELNALRLLFLCTSTVCLEIFMQIKKIADCVAK